MLFAVLLLAAVGCRPGDSTANDQPVHLEERLAEAHVQGSEAPKDPPVPAEWRFDEPRPEWQPVMPLLPGREPVAVSRVDDALRLTLSPANRFRRQLQGGVSLDLPAGWSRHDWSYAVVRARATGPVRNLALGANLRRAAGDTVFDFHPFESHGESVPVIADGAVHRYLLRADWGQEGETAWRQFGLLVEATRPASLDVLSISLIPKEAGYAKEKAGIVTEPRDQVYRRALYLHAPGKVSIPVRVPERGRLDFGLGVLRADAPVTFRVTVGKEALFEETYRDKDRWGQRSLDLSRWAGRRIALTLAADAPGRPGTVALWAAPTLSGVSGVSGARKNRRPNVILYVIDAGGALYTSAYGAHRRTTPNLERLAAQGALFEHAYSNSTWSKPSTASFMTSLQHSVLGGYENPADPLPDQARTMAQILHDAGWQTGVFTSNAWCGVLSNLERGVDFLRETVPGPNSTSSRELHEAFFRWRDAYPGQPYWVHFQTTDVHWPWEPVPPIAGTFLSGADRDAFHEMERRLGEASGASGRDWALRAAPALFQKAGVDPRAYFDGVRGVYDEALAHNDFQLGRLVEQLQARGEWEDTLLIVTADHGDWPGLGYLGDLNPFVRIPNFHPYLTRVPLVVVWPGRIAPGQRFAQPVSLLDLLPTILELSGEPVPEALQGQSLAPLLLGQPGWEPRPVILDEFNVDSKTKRLQGFLEIVDGRWGASLALGQEGEGRDAGPPLVLYDLWNDPFCKRSLHAERPGLAKKYRALLERRFREHLRRAKGYTRSGEGALSSEQLQTLKSLGYL
jgi:arylsulfatase A-like enzyme